MGELLGAAAGTKRLFSGAATSPLEVRYAQGVDRLREELWEEEEWKPRKKEKKEKKEVKEEPQE